MAATHASNPGSTNTDPKPVKERANSGACGNCLRRSWLLTALSGSLDYCARDPVRFFKLLALEDLELLQALGGRRRRDLSARYAEFDPTEPQSATGVQAICTHSPDYPRALRAYAGAAPHALHFTGAVKLLRELCAQPAVAIVGTRRATDYGMAMARSLARGLAATGITVTSGFDEGIPAAVHAGALEVNGPTLTVMPGGLDVCRPASRRALYERLMSSGSAVSELPCGFLAPRWGRLARDRVAIALAGLVIVVEAEDTPVELASAHMTQAAGAVLAVMPGRVTSPASCGTHALLMQGAHLVRGPQDALDLLYGVGERSDTAGQITQIKPELELRLRKTLEQVGAGRDTPAKLTAEQANVGEIVLALTELELLGLLTRGDGGRYVPSQSVTP
jgi:DNA processing protein